MSRAEGEGIEPGTLVETAGDERPCRTRVYLVRHGITEWNRDRRFQGQLDVPLSAEGREQASAVAEWFASQAGQVTAVYSSDLARASQTAEAIARRLGVPLAASSLLREVHCGEWQGLSVDEVVERYPGQLQKWRELAEGFAPPGGEDPRILQARMFEEYRQILGRHQGQATVIVSHGMALAALQAAIHGWDLGETWRDNRARLGNTGVTLLEIDDASGEAHTLLRNSVSHLERPTGLQTVMDSVV